MTAEQQGTYNPYHEARQIVVDSIDDAALIAGDVLKASSLVGGNATLAVMAILMRQQQVQELRRIADSLEQIQALIEREVKS